MSLALLNGQPASADDLRALALVNYGHYSSMQVRDGRVQGIDLHRARLESANLELFASALEFEHVRTWMRETVADAGDCTLRVTVFSRAFDYRRPTMPTPVDVLVSATPPASGAQAAIRVRSYPFQRPLPQVKHVGTFPLFHYRRLAMQAGVDDALFVGTDGAISEGSVWNLGLWDGESVVWPEAPALRGTSEQLLRRGLPKAGVGQRSLPVGLAYLAGYRAAFACNAKGVQAILAIDDVVFPGDPGLLDLLGQALAAEPWAPI